MKTIVLVCKTCRNTYDVHYSRELSSNYCSLDCRDKGYTLDLDFECTQYTVNNNGCWIYKGVCNPYARVGKTKLSRYILKLTNPKIYACHTCDTKACINPQHLFPGTPLENMEDKVAKGRQSRTGNMLGDKLNTEDVKEILMYKKVGLTVIEICNIIQRPRPTVSSIFYGYNWKHITLN